MSGKPADLATDALEQLSRVMELVTSEQNGVVCLDLQGAILYANERAKRVLANPEGLLERDTTLTARLAADSRLLRRLISEALPQRGGLRKSGTMAIQRRGKPPLTLHIHPVTLALGGADPELIAALVLIREPDGSLVLDPEAVARTLGLTPTESLVAIQIARGRTIAEIARDSGRSENTVRWTVKNALAKTGSRRQADLVRMVLRCA